MEENTTIEEETETIEVDGSEVITTAVIFGAGALTGVFGPKVYRSVKNGVTNCRDAARDRIEKARSKREDKTEDD